MENSGNISDSIIQSSTPSVASTATGAGTSGTGTGTGILDKIRSFNIVTWVIIILILAVLGFNVFTYLAAGTQDVSQILTTILNKILDIIPYTLNKIENGVEQAQAPQSQSQSQTPEETNSKTTIGTTPVQNQEVHTNNNEVNNVLNNVLNNKQQATGQQTAQQSYQPYEATSSVTGDGETGQSGWCYIGDDRNIRTCAQVNENDTCMSGKIFPSQEICMYPDLRP
jgi:hypothetical protein